MLSEKIKSECEKIIERYPLKKAALIPILHIIQDEYGYISEEAMLDIARILEVTPIEVYETTSFYTMFNTKPRGKYLLQVCTNISCSLLGGEHILEYIQNKLNIKVGETTPDNKFTLLTVECLGSCGTAPVMQINGTYYEQLTIDKVNDILERLLRE